MLETVRENLKGTLVIVVVIIFIVPMVISGVGTSYMGGVSSSDVANVDGESVSERELVRAIRMQRNQILSQNSSLDESSPFLTDESLRQPALSNLTRQLALVSSAKDGGMAVSDTQFGNVLKNQQEFFTDGKFNKQKYRTMLAQAQFDPSSYRRYVGEGLLVGQQGSGLQNSAFSTPFEFEQIVKLTHQKRTFYSVKILSDSVDGDIDVTDADIQTYYEKNQNSFQVSEKLQVEYLELNLDELASSITVAEGDIQEQYNSEIQNFVGNDQHRISHVLIEDNSEEKLRKVTEALAISKDFSDVAKEFSEDIATNTEGGDLGVMSPGMYPKEFEDAVYQLKVGEVSAPVKTDAGTHIIKLTKKIEPAIPSLEQRRLDIEKVIARAQAAEEFALQIDSLSELTFSAEDLTGAANELGLSIEETAFFDRASGAGIALEASVREAAFSEEVKNGRHNSKLIELSSERSVVIRVKAIKDAYIKPLEEVKTLVEARVKDEKIKAALVIAGDMFEDRVRNGADPEEASKALSYEFKKHELVKRSDVSVDRQTVNLAFKAPKPSDGKVSYMSESGFDGSYWLVAVSSVQAGNLSDLEEAEKTGFVAQLTRGSATLEGSVYEASVFEDVKVVIK